MNYPDLLQEALALAHSYEEALVLAEILPMASEERLVMCIDEKKGNCADLTEWLPGFESVLFFPYLLVYEEPTHSSFALADKKMSTNLPHLRQANIHSKEQNMWKYVNISKMWFVCFLPITSLNNSHALLERFTAMLQRKNNQAYTEIHFLATHHQH